MVCGLASDIKNFDVTMVAERMISFILDFVQKLTAPHWSVQLINSEHSTNRLS